MRAAVLSAYGETPAYGTYDEPPVRPGEERVFVRAAALSNLVRAQAAGRHYSAHASPPLVPGVDGVGRLADGSRVYFAFPSPPFGAMGEIVSLDASLTVRVPEAIDDVTAAAAGNPGMSSMIALRHRARFERGESVLVNGATGVAGRLAVSLARELGARTIVATGRDPAALASLERAGADVTIPLGGPPGDAVARFRREIHAHGISVVLDYLWGEPASQVIAAIAGGGSRHAEPRMRYVNIGSSAGATIALPAGTLRSSGLELMGSGLGSVSYEDIVAAAGDFFLAFVHGKFELDAAPVPLADVATAWNDTRPGRRIVFTTDA